MTRINLVPVTELMDQHLVAEYREMTMVPASLQRTLKSKTGFNKKRISKTYTLNSGHVYFFYDKGRFLWNRYALLVNEMKKRGMNPDPERIFPYNVFVDNQLYNDYNPTQLEIEVSRDRIRSKIQMKPHWYRKTSHKEVAQ